MGHEVCVQTSDTHSAVLWELAYPGLSQINKSPHNDLSWFLFYTPQLHLLQPRVFKRGLISPPLGRAEMWKTIWPSKIIHWLLPRGNLSQTLSNSFHKDCNSLTLEFNSVPGDFIQRQRYRLIGPQHYLWGMSPGDKNPTHWFSRCILSPSGKLAKRNIPKNVYYSITHKLYLEISGFALKRKSMHNALQPTPVLSSSKADLESPCLHPSIVIFLVEAPILQPGTTASRQFPSTLIKNRHITLCLQNSEVNDKLANSQFPYTSCVVHFLHFSTSQPFYLETLSSFSAPCPLGGNLIF